MTVDPGDVDIVDFWLPILPRITSGPAPAEGERGSMVTGVTVTAEQLTAGATINFGGGLTISNVNLVGDTFTFDVAIAADAQLGGRSLSVVNQGSVEDGIDVLVNAFQVLPAVGDVPAPSSARVYVTDSGRSTVRVYGVADNFPLGTIDVCCNPQGIFMSPDGSLAYVNGGDGRITVIDTRLGEVGEEVAWFDLYGVSGTESMATTATHAYAIGSGINQIWVLDPATWEVSTTIALDAPPVGVGIEPVNQQMYVLHRDPESVAVIDIDPGSASFQQVVSTVPVPGGTNPYAVDFTADGSRAYVGGYYDTCVIDTSLALSDPGAAVVAYLPGWAGPLDINLHTASGKELAFFESSGQVAVVDVSTSLPEPQLLHKIDVGLSAMGLRANDGELFVASAGSIDMWQVDVNGLLSGETSPMSRFDGPETTTGLGNLGGGVAIGVTPGGPPSAAPTINSVTGPVETGTPFTLTINGSNFDPDSTVWLQGTPDRGTVTSATATQLVVDFPGTTPGGDFPVVVTNPVPGGGASALSTALAEVQLPSGFAPTQKLYVTSYGEGVVGVFNSDGSTEAIPTLPYPAGMAVTPDGRLGFVSQMVNGPRTSWDELPEHYYDIAALDLDPASQGYLKAIKQIPWNRTGFKSLGVTPNLDNPNGVFVYAPNYVNSDTVAVIDPNTLAEVDVDGDPNTSSLPPNHPYWYLEAEDVLSGINRIELDENLTDRSRRPIDVALTPDGALLYVANYSAGLSIVDTVTRQVIKELTADGNLEYPVEVVITPTNSGSGVFVYVLGRDSALDPFLFIFEAENTNDLTALVDQIPLPLNPRSMAISEDGETVYVAANLGYPDLRSEIYVVDVRPTERVIKDQFDLPGRVYRLTEAADDRLLYLSGLWNSSIYVVDLAPGAGYPLVTTLRAPACPLDVAVEPSAGVVHPIVGGVNPSFGLPDGGDAVVISGGNFAPGATVEFGPGNFATEVEVVGSYAIRAVTPGSVPPDTPGTVDVTVRNIDGRSHTLFNGFTYEPDTTEPDITTLPYVSSQVLAGDPPTVTVQIRWGTDEASTSVVDYGLVGESLPVQESNSAPATDHLVTLTGLEPETDYEFRATSVDGSGNDESSPEAPATQQFTTPVAPDTTPPQISSGPTVSASTHSALIQWITDEEATSVLQYDSVVGDERLDRQAFGAEGLSHSVNLTGLIPNTKYEYSAVSVDASGNGPTFSPVSTFTTVSMCDEVPPMILAGPEPTYISNDLVIIQWETDEDSTSFVNYGTSSILEQGTVDLDRVTHHVVFLTNLQPGTVYGYQVGSTDECGNTVVSADPFTKATTKIGTSYLSSDMKAGVVTLKAGGYLARTESAIGFTTPEQEDNTAPEILSVDVVASSFDRILVTVETDEDSSLLVRYRAGDQSGSAFDPTVGQSSIVLVAGLDPLTIYDLTVEVTDPKELDDARRADV